jgi:uncharacterized protein (TIGR03435 family)
MKNQSLKALVKIAYHLNEDRIFGGSKWVESDRFDVEARAAGPAKDDELLVMLQNMLAERFRLAIHRETRAISAYALELDKGGIKVPAAEGCTKSSSRGSRGKFSAECISMAKLADALTRILRNPVVDTTGAPGSYSFTLEYAPEDPRPAAAPGDALPEAPTGPSLVTVLHQKLGVKLESKKMPVEAIVIDRAEKPTEN